MKVLSKDQILAANDRKTIDVPVPQWGGVVRLAVMSGAERDAFHSSREGGTGTLGEFEASILAATIVDADGNQVFTTEDIDALRTKNKDVLDMLTSEAAKLNGIGQAALESAEKNSEAAPSGDSGSGSLSTSE
ncbi:hypothetical protein [Pandoraea bronchicola]|uniref:Phage tail protein n=1 Tax=Pandoraea bronchicola TaxID=2508287 RepID=A0A5E5C1A0_9BURK|nr:hypothetical protein [Pandoraea bronchicola]VVE90400.1 hypothetical protein PBR20603_04384 [Pandoraea bronchicola]